MNNKCEHGYTRRYWVDGYECDMGYRQPGYWEGEYVSTCVDIDVHRYQCTRCEEIMYYSDRAREAYESGDLSKLP